MTRASTTDEGFDRRSGPPTVSVVIPALNEERNLPYVFSRLPDGLSEVILVDGGSVDRTVETARQLLPKVIVVDQTRTGKGNALACGFAACTSDIVVMIDADGSTDPAEIPRFLDALMAGAEFAKGSRFRPGGDSHDITRFRRLGNYFLCGVVNLLFRTHFSDLCYGYNAFWRSALPSLDIPDPDGPRMLDANMLWGDGFEIETLINVRAAARGLAIHEVASIESERLHGASNLNAFRDGTRVLRTIFRELRRHRGWRVPIISAWRRRVHLAKLTPVPPAGAARANPTVPHPRTPTDHRTPVVESARAAWPAMSVATGNEER
jgi:glycosyltransferase involved in cell wall biosynthesis